MFEPKIFDGEIFGYQLQYGRGFYFFGTRHLTKARLNEAFPQFRFAFLKQVHGRAVLEARDDVMQVGDGHYTSTPGLALVSQTADCMPVLMGDQNRVCALHAGWKGLAQNIISALREVLPQFRPELVALGPHISRSSFEVGHDVAQQLATASPNGEHGLTFTHSNPAKTYFDLHALATRQVVSSFGEHVPLHLCLRDTKSDPLFHSFRRDREQAGRQYSFAVLT